MKRGFLPLPSPDALPPPGELISRTELAELLGINEERIRGWERAGLMPPRAEVPQDGVLLGKPRVLWKGENLREWLDRMVGVVFKRPPDEARMMRKVAREAWLRRRGFGSEAEYAAWLEAGSPSTPSRRPAKLSGKDVVQLTRLEAQVNALPPEPLPSKPLAYEEPLSTSAGWLAVEDDEPFPRNDRRPSRAARYW
jgi:hypothetical protein